MGRTSLRDPMSLAWANRAASGDCGAASASWRAAQAMNRMVRWLLRRHACYLGNMILQGLGPVEREKISRASEALASTGTGDRHVHIPQLRRSANSPTVARGGVGK